MRHGLLAALLTALIMLVSAAAAEANTIVVNDTGDPAGPGACLNGGQCSLRQAVGTASSDDTVHLDAKTYSLTQGTDIEIAKPLTIEGAAVDQTTIDGSQNSAGNTVWPARIFRVDRATVTIENLTLTGGDDGADEKAGAGSPVGENGGGALFNNSGDVTVSNVAFADNPGGGLGGAISNTGGTLTMTDVSFSDDQASIGGALFTHSGTVTGTGVTFENDGSGCCNLGAVYLLGGTVSFTNTTVVGSGGPSSVGGGIHNGGATLTLTNDTLSGNVRGSLMTDTRGSTSVENTIIGNGISEGDGDCVAPGEPDDATDASSGPAITSDLGHNIDQDGSCNLTASGDVPNHDPQLAPIADNGGPTRTQALLAGSPALGDPAAADCPTKDQRGISRPRGSCDIGAFEAFTIKAPATPTTDAAQNVTDTCADLAGTINLNGEAGGFHFVYGTAPDQLANRTEEAAAGIVSEDTPETETLAGLSPGTTYYYAAVADNATASTTAENVKSFTTSAGAPQVSALELASFTDTTGTIAFAIDPEGADTTYVVKYGTDALNQQTDPVDIGSAAGSQDLSATLTDLAPATTYFFEVVATNSAAPDGVDSNELSLTTDPQVTGKAGSPVSISDSGKTFRCPDRPTVNWGDGGSDLAQVSCSPGPEDDFLYQVTDGHIYKAPGHYHVTITYDDLEQTTDQYAQISPGSPPPPPPPTTPSTPSNAASPPAVAGGAPTNETIHGASVAGTVNPENGPTQAFFEYGLDLSQRGPGASSTLYDQSTPPRPVGSDQTYHTVTASLTGLVPGGLYHVRLVAVNGAGTTRGPDQTFRAAAAAAPPPPVLGQSEDVQPISGKVFIKTASGQFVPLTGATQIPSGTVIDALQGTLKITTALPGGAGGARDAAANGKKAKAKTKTQSGAFGGAIFKLTQARSGLATLSLVEGAFKGAPSYGSCKAHKAADATIASSKTLQLLKSSAHGKFRTRGRYSAATVRGTVWTVADRCDGTLTHDITHSVAVSDFVRHRTIILHAGQSYLAKPRKGK